DPRACRRTRRQRSARRLCACAARGGGGTVGQAAAAQRRDGDRRGHARSRLPGRCREGGSDSRPDSGAACPPGGGARAARAHVMLDREVETRPWSEQLELDDRSFRKQLAYLLERSPFYRDKLADFEAAGLGDIAQLPLTEKDELRATRTADNPFGAHLCVPESEIVRIYSTSGTTGTPSYVPLTTGDLENWVTASARSYAASGIARGER